MKIYRGGLENTKTGAQELAAAEGAQGKAEAAAIDKGQLAMQRVVGTYEKNQKALQGEYDSVFKDLKEGHIDPGAVWANKNAPRKVSTIVGILLSGLGSGLSAAAGQNQENMAMKILNQEIDRDIDAQKANMQQKGNMLSALSNQMGNLRAGTEMLRAIQMGATAREIEKAGALAKDPVAQARAKQFAGQLDMTSSAQIAKLNAQQTIAQIQQEINKHPGDAHLVQALITATEKVNPEKAKELRANWVPGLGFANKDKDAQDLKEALGAADNIKSGVNRLLEINKIQGKSLTPALRAEADSIVTGLKGPMRTALGLGTLSEGDMKLLDNLIRNPTNIFSLDSSTKKALETLQKRTDDGVASIAKSRGFSVPSSTAAAPTEDAKSKANLDWAKANPTDPRAKAYLKLKGL